MTNEIDAYKAKLAAAYSAGYSGDRAVAYAECIPGDDVEAAKAYAEKLASVAKALSANRQPPADFSNDKTDDSAAARDFKDVIAEELDR